MSALWVFSEIVDFVGALLFFVLGVSGSLFAYGLAGPGLFRRFSWRAKDRPALRWLAPLVVLLSVAVLVFQVRDLLTFNAMAVKPHASDPR